MSGTLLPSSLAASTKGVPSLSSCLSSSTSRSDHSAMAALHASQSQPARTEMVQVDRLRAMETEGGRRAQPCALQAAHDAKHAPLEGSPRMEPGTLRAPGALMAWRREHDRTCA